MAADELEVVGALLLCVDPTAIDDKDVLPRKKKGKKKVGHREERERVFRKKIQGGTLIEGAHNCLVF